MITSTQRTRVILLIKCNKTNLCTDRLHTSSTSKFLYEEIELKKEQKEEQKKVLKKEQKRAEEKHIIEKSRSTSNKPKKENKIEVRLNIYLKFNSCVMMLPREINKVLKHTDTKVF